MSNYKSLSSESIDIEEKSHRLLHDNTRDMRIVTEQQCNAMKKNCLFLLKEINGDEHRPLNRQEFVITCKQILPSSDNAEIEKLFDFIDGDTNNTTKTVSFHHLLNHTQNFHKLLYSMGCTHSDQQDEDDDSYTDTETDEEEPELPLPKSPQLQDITKTRKTKVQFKMPPLEENTIIPQLSWKHTFRTSPADNTPFIDRNLSERSTLSERWKAQKHERNPSNNTMHNVNIYNYNEYIKYQKEQMMELKYRVDELNRYEIKCNELQLILDTKHKEIRILKEEIKQFEMDKNEYIFEINNIREQCHELTQKYMDLDDLRKCHDVERTQTDEMLKQVNELKLGWNSYREQSDSLQEEKRKLDALNTQFTQMNDRLKNELEKERHNTQKLKTVIDTNDEMIRSLTLDSLGKDQLITTLQCANEDLTNQLNLALSMRRPPSTVGGDTEIMDWGYGQSVYTMSPRAADNLEFDIFEDLDVHYLSPQKSVMSSQADLDLYRGLSRLLTPKQASNASGWGITEKGTKNVVIKLTDSTKEIEDEKINEEHEDTVILLNRIHSLEEEIRRYRNKTLHDYERKKSIRKQKRNVGFWESLFARLDCVPLSNNGTDTD